jgi:hypothetical protein
LRVKGRGLGVGHVKEWGVEEARMVMEKVAPGDVGLRILTIKYMNQLGETHRPIA